MDQVDALNTLLLERDLYIDPLQKKKKNPGKL